MVRCPHGPGQSRFDLSLTQNRMIWVVLLGPYTGHGPIFHPISEMCLVWSFTVIKGLDHLYLPLLGAMVKAQMDWVWT